MQLLDGKKVAAWYRRRLRTQVEARRKDGVYPELAIVLAGEDTASAMYVSSMKKAAEAIGLQGTIHRFAATVTEETLLSCIERLNGKDEVFGILVMLPLPSHIHANRVINAICPEKDVDGLTDSSVARLYTGKPSFIPCTPKAVMAVLAYYHIALAGKEVVIVGRSNIVGKPLAQLCLQENATVTVCHSHTQALSQVVRRADVVIGAVGKAACITGDMIKPGAVVIDIGINCKNGKTVGDVAFDEAAKIAGAITPVPGGIGAVTTTMVLENVLTHK